MKSARLVPSRVSKRAEPYGQKHCCCVIVRDSTGHCTYIWRTPGFPTVGGTHCGILLRLRHAGQPGKHMKDQSTGASPTPGCGTKAGRSVLLRACRGRSQPSAAGPLGTAGPPIEQPLVIRSDGVVNSGRAYGQILAVLWVDVSSSRRNGAAHTPAQKCHATLGMIVRLPTAGRDRS